MAGRVQDSGHVERARCYALSWLPLSNMVRVEKGSWDRARSERTDKVQVRMREAGGAAVEMEAGARSAQAGSSAGLSQAPSSTQPQAREQRCPLEQEPCRALTPDVCSVVSWRQCGL